jgi:hypothetical protein
MSPVKLIGAGLIELLSRKTPMPYWLVKTEPTSYSFADLMAEPGRTTGWNGVRNYQARNFLRDCGNRRSRARRPS